MEKQFKHFKTVANRIKHLAETILWAQFCPVSKTVNN